MCIAIDNLLHSEFIVFLHVSNGRQLCGMPYIHNTLFVLVVNNYKESVLHSINPYTDKVN
jgi:hypothetical protein